MAAGFGSLRAKYIEGGVIAHFRNVNPHLVLYGGGEKMYYHWHKELDIGHMHESCVAVSTLGCTMLCTMLDCSKLWGHTGIYGGGIDKNYTDDLKGKQVRKSLEDA